MTSLICLLGCKVLKLLFSITYRNHDYIYLLKRCSDSENKSLWAKIIYFYFIFKNNFIYLSVSDWAGSLLLRVLFL